ncbi:MAG: phenylalanine--tRNA ligase subunit beta [Steroidobacteraceae bacterium]|nr:phenylalanine--tRNA ligase subunit beta [Steroidobacteraceae bacterium]
MKLSLDWLRDWVDVALAPADLGARLTMAGFELESATPAAPAFSGVVVARILSAERHPQADKLQVCRVDAGQGGEPLQIVCGAPNARAGLVTALARVGAVLPNDVSIKAARLRGVESAGMLCSARELGLSEGHEGILELPADAAPGQDLRTLLGLDDTVLELNVTPNRGDAMSVIGLAREVATLTGQALRGPAATPVAASLDATFPVRLDAAQACPRFLGRAIDGVDNGRASPAWLRERLRRCGVRSISPVVDVTNYVLLELGQPMHAYDRDRLRQGIHVRHANEAEPLELLDGRRVELASDVLVIADAEGPVGLAGIMGGARTAVQSSTTRVFLEVAWFAPQAIAGRARRFGLTTDASQRFERGVDPEVGRRAIERATELLLAIAGGAAGPVVATEAPAFLPVRTPVRLRRARLQRLLGVLPADATIESLLGGLGMKVARDDEGFVVTPPPHRFDVAIEPDLVEEVARLVGYDSIPEAAPARAQRLRPMPESLASERRVLDALAARGFNEVVSFAFVEPGLQQRLFPGREAVALANPISADLAVMRVSLWPGLVRVILENQRRQQDRLRLFEHGVVFQATPQGVHELDVLAGALTGSRAPEHWGSGRDGADFFDLKGDLEALLAATGRAGDFAFAAAEHPCLHPGRSARVLRDGIPVGWIGELHPEQVRALDLTSAPQLFELEYDAALRVEVPAFAEVSRYPQVRRDLAFTVDEELPFSPIRERVTFVATGLLKDLRVFDIYRGAGVEPGRKSVALGLIFQDNSRTLTDEDVDRLMQAIREDLGAKFQARFRE